jgi:hypothetical protein
MRPPPVDVISSDAGENSELLRDQDSSSKNVDVSITDITIGVENKSKDPFSFGVEKLLDLGSYLSRSVDRR